MSRNWKFQVRNINVPSWGKSNNSSSGRFINAPGNQVNIIGNINVKTFRENILCGGLYIAPDVVYKGYKVPSGDSNSVVWFYNTQNGTGDKNMTIDKGFYASFSRNSESGDDGDKSDVYPAIYSQINNININENATLNLDFSWVGFSNQADDSSNYSKNLNIGKNANFFVRVTKSHSPIYLPNSTKTIINSDQGANIDIRSENIKIPVISGSTSGLNQTSITFNSPAQDVLSNTSN